MRGRPLSNRKKVQLALALTILAWATQTLLHQWARGDEVSAIAPGRPVAGGPGDVVIPADAQPDPRSAEPADKFVPSPQRSGIGATLELRGEATVYGPEVRLKQICRWSNADEKTFLPVADLVVIRFDGKVPFRSISLDELRTTLHDARVNLSVVRFAGELGCTVHRSDTHVEQKDALQQWIDAREAVAGPPAPATAPAAPSQVAWPSNVQHPQQPSAPAAPLWPAAPASALAQPAAAIVARSATPAPAPASVETAPVRSLRTALTEDLAVRLHLPIEQLQITFNPKDDRALNLSEPQFRFNLQATRAWDLGDVTWDVLIVHEGGTQKLEIGASARAWQNQLVISRPLGTRQLIRADDVTERRVLVDKVSDEPLLTAAQAVGQEASRELKPGTVLTSRMVDAVALAKPGQFITISLSQGGIHVKTVGRAMEGGSFGQIIKVKNEATEDIYQVTLTGPQEGNIGTPAPR